LQYLAIKLGRLTTGKANLLGKIVGQHVDEFSIALLVEERLVYEFCVLKGRVGRVGGDDDVEVEG
jgi:hypothetical protein